jgi:excinuclease UvrABC ATPase subunit
VLVVEHEPDATAVADHVVDLDPGAGLDGGRIVFAGTPSALVAARSTLTGAHLASYVGA